jgi:cytochrome c oxidase subunit 3
MALVTAPATSPGAGDTLPVAASTAPAIVLPTGEPTPGPAGRPRRGTTTIGTLLFAAADAMVLAAMVAVYVAVKDGSSAWPPKGVHVGTYIPTMVTITAVMSAFSAQWAVYSSFRNDQRNATIALGLTAFLGLAMVNAEWLMLSRVSFGLKTHAYGTLFHLLVGFHIVHVVVGMALLAVLAFRVLAGHFSTDRHDPVRATVVFWQFTNVVWFVVVTALFIVSRHG